MYILIGNKNYSSWSLRPWLAMKMAGLTFEEEVISLYNDASRKRLGVESPNKHVPLLKDGDVTVWESYAICEYIADKIPEAMLWPADIATRAEARAISCEMVSSFFAMRDELPMNIRRKKAKVDLSDAALADVAHVDAIWARYRKKYGAGGPFLFGHFTIADAMYTPVVFRLDRYDCDVSEASRAYMDAILDLRPVRDWVADAEKEPWVIEGGER